MTNAKRSSHAELILKNVFAYLLTKLLQHTFKRAEKSLALFFWIFFSFSIPFARQTQLVSQTSGADTTNPLLSEGKTCDVEQQSQSYTYHFYAVRFTQKQKHVKLVRIVVW